MTCWRCGHDLIPEAYLLRCPVCDWSETRRTVSLSAQAYRQLRDSATEIVALAHEIAGDEPMHPAVCEAVQKLQELAEGYDELQGQMDRYVVDHDE